jgi:hypothetical protein
MASAARRVRTTRAASRAAEAKGSNDGARNEGSGNDEAKASAALRAYASAASNSDEAVAVAARRTSLAARCTSKGGDTDDGAYDKGSDNNKARASAPRAYASSSLDKASPIAARRGRAASAARRMAGGGEIVNGTSDEGSGDDKADTGAAKRKYGTSAPSDNDKAGATLKRLAHASVGKHARQGHPSGREATHAAARRSGGTKVARRTGMGKVAADANRDDVSIRDAYSDIDAGDNTDDDTGCRAAKKRPYSPQDYSTDDGVDEEARSTNEGAPKVAYAAAAWEGAARGAATQRGKGDPKANHEATSEADQVEDSGKEADSKANRGRGKARTHPMKNRADAEALPKFSRGASARSREEDEPLNDAGMAKLERHMAVRGTTAARFARRARKEEAAPGWKGNGAYYRACTKAITKAPDPLGVALSPEAAGRIYLAMVNRNGHFSVLHNLARFEELEGMRSQAGGHLVAFEGEV